MNAVAVIKPSRPHAVPMKGHLVIGVQDTAWFRRTFPHGRLARHKGKVVGVVPHGSDETALLRNMGVIVPAPILHTYRWPGRFAPMAHQKETAAFLTLIRRGFVLSDMGVGKTASALWALDYLLRVRAIRRVLVVCPLSVMGVWINECFAVTPHRTIITVHGTKEKRRGLLAHGTEICVINHDGIMTVADEIRAGGFDLVIVDEASAYRNASTRRYKLLRSVLDPSTRLWLLTGTPTPQAPTDAWALSRLVNRDLVPSSMKRFRESTMLQVSTHKWIAKRDAKETVWAALQPAIRHAKEDCLDLPPVVYTERHCELTDDQKLAFEKMKKTLRIQARSGEVVTAANAAVRLVKLLQILAGAVRGENGSLLTLEAHGRLKALDEVIEEAGHKVVVFVPFRAVMEQVAAHVRKRWSCEVVHGDVSQTERNRIFTAFQKSEHPRVLIAHPKVASHGLTFTAADTTVWYSPLFQTELYQQANERMNRPGQLNHMLIVHIIAHKMEQTIYEALKAHQRLQDTILQLHTNTFDMNTR